MDPIESTFVQHNLGDVIERFLSLLIFLLGISVFFWGALKVVFDTRLYNRLLGKGIDGKPSRWFPGTDPRPWISMALGVILAYGLYLNAFLYLVGVTLEEFVVAGSAYRSIGYGNPIVAGMAWHLGIILTGLALGAGPKALIAMSKTFGQAKDKIVNNVKEG